MRTSHSLPSAIVRSPFSPQSLAIFTPINKWETLPHFELHPLNRVLLLNGEALPPSRERIDEEVAGLGGTAEGHMELGGVFIENPTRNILFRAPKVMVTRFVLPASFSPARERPNLDRSFTVHAQPLDPGDDLARLVFF